MNVMYGRVVSHVSAAAMPIVVLFSVGLVWNVNIFNALLRGGDADVMSTIWIHAILGCVGVLFSGLATALITHSRKPLVALWGPIVSIILAAFLAFAVVYLTTLFAEVQPNSVSERQSLSWLTFNLAPALTSTSIVAAIGLGLPARYQRTRRRRIIFTLASLSMVTPILLSAWWVVALSERI